MDVKVSFDIPERYEVGKGPLSAASISPVSSLNSGGIYGNSRAL